MPLWLFLCYLAYSAIPTFAAWHLLFKIEDKRVRLALAVACGVVPWFLFVFWTAEVFFTWFPLFFGWIIYSVGLLFVSIMLYEKQTFLVSREEYEATRRDVNAARATADRVRLLYDQANFPRAPQFVAEFLESFKGECDQRGVRVPDDETLAIIRQITSDIYRKKVLLKPAAFNEKEFSSTRWNAVNLGVRTDPDDENRRRLKVDGKFTLDASKFEVRLSDPEHTLCTVRTGLAEAFLVYLRATPPFGRGFRVPLGAFQDPLALGFEMSSAFARANPPVELDGVPFAPLLDHPISFQLPTATRFQHQWVIAPTGSGKTQLLQTQILADLESVASGDASLVIMDSQGMGDGKFLSNVARLKMFAKGQPLENKLVILQPDPENPLALNLFDMGQHDPSLSARDRQILHMSALKMITFCLAGTTDQQQDMIEYLVQLAMVVPNANIGTVRRMLSIRNIKEFESEFGDALAVVDETVREYFLHSYFGQGQGGVQATTREAVLRRIMGMLRNPVFRKMYQNDRNKFSMLREIEAGKVIVINTDIELMGKEACELFGRFFISLLVQATQQRKSSKPVYCYIDECQDYIARDENIADLLDKARKQNVGLVLAHQRLANIAAPNVLDALSNTAIKFAGGNITDAPTLARYMRTRPEFIADQPALSFATFIRGQTPSAVRFSVQYGAMEKLERMTEQEYADVQRDMCERYAASPGPLAPTATPPLQRGNVTDLEWEDVV